MSTRPAENPPLRAAELIPEGAAARPHILESRRGPGSEWQLVGRCQNKAEAAAKMRQFLLTMGVDNVRIRPEPSDRLRREERMALRLALVHGSVRTLGLAGEMGSTTSSGNRYRASRALQRLRELGLLQSADATLGHGSHTLTAQGRSLLAKQSNGDQ